MSRVVILTGMALVLGTGLAFAGGGQNTMSSGRPSAVLTPDRCTELWKIAVPTGDALAEAASGPFVVNFKQIDTDGNGSISVEEFQAACGKGMIKDTGQK